MSLISAGSISLDGTFKISIWQKRRWKGWNVLSPLLYLKVWKKIVSIGNLVDTACRGFVFRLCISPGIRSQNRNGWILSVRDLCRTGLCKNPRNPPHCNVPLKKSWHKDFFRLLFFPWIIFSLAPENPIEVISNFTKILWDNFVFTTGETTQCMRLIIAGVVDTGDYALSQIPTPAIKFSPVTSTPAINLTPCQLHRPWNCWMNISLPTLWNERFVKYLSIIV